VQEVQEKTHFTVENRPLSSLKKNINKPGTTSGRPLPERIGKYFTTILLGSIIIGLCVFNFDIWLVLASVFFGAAFILRQGVAVHRVVTSLLAIGVLFSSITYMSWRWQTVNWDAWWVAVPLCLAETLGVFHILGFQYTIWPRTQPALEKKEDPTRHPVFIFIPTVNEGVEILKPTIEAAKVARDNYLKAYPHGKVEIIICNDGYVAKASNWTETEKLAQDAGVKCITRKVGGGAKAGNLEAARQQVNATGNAFIVIFDADQIAHPDFLLKTIQPLADPSIGWVQTGQYYSNLENPVARWANDQQALFYKILCPGKAKQNAAFICGTNVVIRAAALDEIGGLPQNSITEDFAASIDLHGRWRSIFLSDVLATGLGPMDLPSYFKQQRRWATGTMSVLRTHWRNIFLPENLFSNKFPKDHLSLGQRTQYAIACTHYFCGLRDAIYLVAPIIFLLFGIPAVKGATLDGFFVHFLPYLIVSQLSFWYMAWGKTSYRGIILGFGSFPILIGSIVTAFFGKRIGFSITAKHREGNRAWRYLAGFASLLVISIVSLVIGLSSNIEDGPVLVSAFWVGYSMLLLGGFLWLVLADFRLESVNLKNKSAAKRIVAPSLKTVRPVRPLKRLVPVSVFAGVLIPLVFMGIWVTNNETLFASNPGVFTPTLSGEQVRIGASLPYELLNDRPAKLSQEFGTNLAIVGRTQDITDSFDRNWADDLNAKGSRPWITLLFEGTQPSYELKPLDSSLPSIINGLHDEAIKRWAQEIRAYGGPVYLTVLPHVDKNWSQTSAVSKGGIPQDTAQAWAHVREIFQQEKANNVAWVWAPADPVHDQEFAPPANQVDITLISFLNYPDTTWLDPATTLSALAARYPNKPLFVEVSLAGPAEQKVEWLNKLGEAVKQTPTVYSLLYHEGSPDPEATASENALWSVSADPQELTAMRAVIASVNSKK